MLLAAGVDPVTVAGRLGHTNPAITMKVYAAFLPEKDRDAADILDHALTTGYQLRAMPGGLETTPAGRMKEFVWYRKDMSQGSPLKYLAVVVVLTAGVTLLAPASPAAADAFPGPGMRLADNAQHTFCFVDGTNADPAHASPGIPADIAIPAADRARYRTSMNYLDVVTDMWDTELECNTATDVLFAHTDFVGVNEGARGAAVCVDPTADGNRCLSAHIWVDVPQLFLDSLVWYPDGGQPFADNFSFNWWKTIRHEIGHTVGTNNDGVDFLQMTNAWLLGWGDLRGVTVSGWVPSGPPWTAFSQHHIDHINGSY